MRPIDADALLEKFNKKTDIWSALTDEDTSQDFAFFCKLADAVDEMPTVAKDIKVPDKWVSVKDRLPEKSGEYLCWFGANKVAIGPAIVTYVDEWKAFGDLASLEKYPNITHWMPLPEPPKEG